MGFLDSLNVAPAKPAASLVDIRVEQNGLLVRFVWNDGAESSFAGRALRQACPCAGCVDEWTHRRTFEPASVPENLTVSEIHPVGNYALAISFSDRHATGIFPLTYLRELSDH